MTATITTVEPVAIKQRQQTAMDELMAAWFEDISISEVTKKSYVVAMRAFLEWTNENGVDHPQRADILAYKDYLATPRPKRARCDGRGGIPTDTITLSACTQARYLRVVKLFFQWTSQQEGRYHYPNVADHVRGAKVRQGNFYRKSLSREEVLKVLDSIDRSDETGKRDYAMIRFGIMMGDRIIEMLRGDVGDIEIMDDTPVFWYQGKGHDSKDDYRTVDEDTYEAIQDYLQARGNPPASAPLFVSTSRRNKGQRVSEPSLSSIIKKRLVAAGFDSRKITAHSLRHTSVTMFLEATDGDIQGAKMHAGHADISMTMTYAHNMNKLKAKTSQRVADYIDGKKADMAEQAQEAFARLSEEDKKLALAYMKSLARHAAA